jgi:hypothetical protein
MKKTHLIIAIVAVILFTWVITHLSLPSIVQQLKAMRIALPLVLALSALRLYLQSLTWSASLKGGNVSVEIPKWQACGWHRNRWDISRSSAQLFLSR